MVTFELIGSVDTPDHLVTAFMFVRKHEKVFAELKIFPQTQDWHSTVPLPPRWGHAY
jgi:hypothetical protein